MLNWLKFPDLITATFAIIVSYKLMQGGREGKKVGGEFGKKGGEGRGGREEEMCGYINFEQNKQLYHVMQAMECKLGRYTLHCKALVCCTISCLKVGIASTTPCGYVKFESVR